ncbi:YidH family protein [Propioniciclava soli]|uniref:DUF202 domain-containing protein n=1 Tax=Propioniciclava soli TaxID=2775081 RepID=A0ABZ3CAU1_9ACTN
MTDSTHSDEDAPQPASEPSPETTGRGWLTRRLFPDGAEPDPRFTLANERTFLAWMRTSLALLGAGVALEAFAADVFPHLIRHLAALVLVGTALVASLSATYRWHRVETAMRRGRPLPAPSLALLLAVGLTLTSFVLLGLVLGAGA